MTAYARAITEVFEGMKNVKWAVDAGNGGWGMEPMCKINGSIQLKSVP